MIEAARVAASQLNIKLFEGVVATGDQFVSDSERKKWVKGTFKADAIEMEGASVAHVCQQYKISSLIIRSISDTAEDGANVNYNEYLKSSAERSA
jgi:adenosylhomocysteine/aminodeoxyfutalosine nucleosidase